MELSILLALGVLFTGVAMTVIALGTGNEKVWTWRTSVRQKRGTANNATGAETANLIAKLLNKFIANRRMWVGVNLAIVILTMVFGATSGKYPYQILIVIIVLEVILLTWVGSLRRKSKAHIEKGLPNVLDVIARVYRVHADLKVAFAEVAASSEDKEIKSLFAEVVKLARFGLSLEEALDRVAGQIESDDFDFVVTAITLNTPIGGNLPAILENTAKILRDRKEAGDEIKNLMFQSKFSAVAVGILVPLIAAGSLIGSKNAREILLFTPNGRLMFTMALVWWLIGTIIVKRAAKIQI